MGQCLSGPSQPVWDRGSDMFKQPPQRTQESATLLSSWSTEKLRQYCRDRGLYAGGSRQDVEQRVRECLLYGTPQGSDNEEEEEANPADLSSWSTEKLRQYCRDRGLYAGGSRQDVEQRVRECQLYGTPQGSDNEEEEEEELRQYCRDRRLYAGGSRQDVEQRVRECLLCGTPLNSDDDDGDEGA
ncbi:hypothetical protein ABPG75_008308 [Micractinium tetrahymenae]